MNKKVLRFFLCSLVILQLGLLVDCSYAMAPLAKTMPNVKTEMLSSQYWIDKLEHPDDRIMSDDQIQSFNQEMLNELSNYMIDLTRVPEAYSRTDLEKFIDYPFPKSPSFVDGRQVGKRYWGQLKKQLNLQRIKDRNPVKYGFVIHRTNLKIFPVADIVSDAADDPAFDRFQNSGLLVNEPVVILHQSRDKKWFYIRMYNCSGWVLAEDVAICPDKEFWLEEQKYTDFLVVTGNKIKLDCNPWSPELSALELSMGTILPLVGENEIPISIDDRVPYDNYVVKMPVRKRSGAISYKLAMIPVSKDVNVGFLPYTRANVLKQVFKMQGDRYGWGGMLEARDCSGMILDLYCSFGFKLPRNSYPQGMSPGKIADLTNLSLKSKSKMLDQVQSGAILYFPGHVMLYIGNDQGRYYVISALGSYAEFPDNSNKAEIVRTRTVVINDLSVKRGSGLQWIEAITVAKQLEKNTFADLEGFEGREIIENMADRYIINGKAPGRFDPCALISRAEFAAILARGLKLEGDEQYVTEVFNDVSSEWYAGAVGALSKEGYIICDEGGTFAPDKALSQVVLRSIIERILNKYSDVSGRDKEEQSFDAIMNADITDETEKTVSRYEAALVIDRLLTNLNKASD